MAVASLTTSIEDMESAPSVVNYGGGQGGGVNTDIIIEAAQSIGRRTDNTTDHGLGASFTAVDLSGAGEHIKVWMFVTQWASVTQVQIRISSGADDDHELPTTEYPELGGWVPVWVDVSRAPEVGGSANEASISEVGVLLDIGDVGGNAQNNIVDEITHGTSGLEWTGTAGDIDDFLTFEGTNREGVLVQYPSGIALYYRIEIGDGTTATTFTHDQLLTAPDQSLVADTAMGISVDASRSGDTFTGADGGGLLSADPAGATKRPDFIVTGTAATVTLEAGYQLIGLRQITLTSVCTITGGAYDAVAITQGTADISGCEIRTRAATDVACITDPDFTNLADIDFVQAGAGHAIEIDTAGSYTLDGLRGLNVADGGYGANTTNDAALDITAPSGTVTLNITNGGATPTYKTAGATVVINNTKTVTVTVSDSSGVVSGAAVFLEADTGGDLPADDSVTITRSGTTASVSHTGHGLASGDQVVIRGADQGEYNGVQTITNVTANAYDYTVTGSPTTPATGTITSTSLIMTGDTNVSGVRQITDFSYTTDQPVRGWVREGSAATKYKTGPIAGTITDTGFSATVQLVLDQ